MPVYRTEDGDAVSIRVEGRFDFGVYREFRDSYRCSNGRACHYRVDLRQVEHLDSSALGMLLLLLQHADGDARRVRLLPPRHPQLDRLLEIAGMYRLFTLSEAAAPRIACARGVPAPV